MNKLCFEVVPKQFSSFEEMLEIGNFNDYYDFLEKNEIRNFILSPITSMGKEEFFLFWRGCFPQNTLHIGDIYNYLNEKGFKIALNTHFSLFVGVMNVLTEEKLKEIGIPRGVNILFLSSEDSIFQKSFYDKFLLGVNRDDMFSNRRILKVFYLSEYLCKHRHAFVLQIKKKQEERKRK